MKTKTRARRRPSEPRPGAAPLSPEAQQTALKELDRAVMRIIGKFWLHSFALLIVVALITEWLLHRDIAQDSR